MSPKAARREGEALIQAGSVMSQMAGRISQAVDTIQYNDAKTSLSQKTSNILNGYKTNGTIHDWETYKGKIDELKAEEYPFKNLILKKQWEAEKSHSINQAEIKLTGLVNAKFIDWGQARRLESQIVNKNTFVDTGDPQAILDELGEIQRSVNSLIIDEKTGVKQTQTIRDWGKSRIIKILNDNPDLGTEGVRIQIDEINKQFKESAKMIRESEAYKRGDITPNEVKILESMEISPEDYKTLISTAGTLAKSEEHKVKKEREIASKNTETKLWLQAMRGTLNPNELYINTGSEIGQISGQKAKEIFNFAFKEGAKETDNLEFIKLYHMVLDPEIELDKKFEEIGKSFQAGKITKAEANKLMTQKLTGADQSMIEANLLEGKGFWEGLKRGIAGLWRRNQVEDGVVTKMEDWVNAYGSGDPAETKELLNQLLEIPSNVSPEEFEKQSDDILKAHVQKENPLWIGKKVGDWINVPGGAVQIKGFDEDGEPLIEPASFKPE